MARKRYDDDVSTENHERWLISYADLITLLFAFFVVMYAISIVNEGKYQVLSDALGDAFGGRGAATTAWPARLATPSSIPPGRSVCAASAGVSSGWRRGRLWRPITKRRKGERRTGRR